ncbi:hypothetical protein [Halostella litorea]|uniref:hypothetical protein n=1 Tax=Halostella litorea TaxID=2528831 RepID=UPI001092DF31|nr:hypothetical protein [Halostella litorea]
MRSRGETERLRAVLDELDPAEPLTAGEIRDLLAARGVDVDSAHRVATDLGRLADRGDVDVIRDRPYRYRLDDRR